MASLFARMADAGRALRGNPLDNPATPLSSAAAWMYDIFAGAPSAAGVAVNEQTAMQLATVYTCVNILASDVSSLPLRVYELSDKGSDKGRKPAVDSDLYYLLTVQPNPEMTAPVFWQAFVGCAVLTGNGYAQVQWDGAKPIALWPRHPRMVQPVRAKGAEPLQNGGTAKTGDLTYKVTINGTVTYVAQKDMLHLTGLTLDGWVGLSPIQAARQTIGTAIAAENFGAGFFGRGSRPSGLLTPKEALKVGDPRMDQARESWEKSNSGPNQGRTAVMPFGWEWKAIGITPNEAQFLETQQYSRTQIAALYRLPPHMVGDTSRLSNGNHESQAQEYVTFTLRPWLVRIEAEVQRKLMPKIGRTAGKYSVRFDDSELIRGDFASQMTGFAVGKQWGFLNTNEIKQQLGQNPIGPEGDKYYVPLNMVEMGKEPEPDPDDDQKDVTPGNQDPTPAGNGGQNQIRLIERMATAYAPLFRDAVGRTAARSRRDAEAIQQIFGPVLDVIAGEATRQAVTTFRLKPETDLGTEKVLRDCRKAIEKRAEQWDAELATVDVDAELQRTVRMITLNLFREAGSTLALAA